MDIQAFSYLMENDEEIVRLEVKTSIDAVIQQALWCGVKPGQRILDAGCGPGKVTSILRDIIQPGGEIVGADGSEKRLQHARKLYGHLSGIDFRQHNLREPLTDAEGFDLIWVRFVLEYFRDDCPSIIKNLCTALKPGGTLCLLDLDHNSLNHYEMPARLEGMINKVMERLQKECNFDPYAGRRLYSILYDLGFHDIEVNVVPHHLIYGKIRKEDAYNWAKKMEVTCSKMEGLFEEYPGGVGGFASEFTNFIVDPRRFTYTPLIMCKGAKPTK